MTDSVVIPTTPAEIKATAGYPTLAELRQIKAAWLEAAIENGDIAACTKVAQVLGEQWYPSALKDKRPQYFAQRWNQGDLHIHYRDSGAQFIPALGRHEETSIVWVTKGEWLTPGYVEICSYVSGDDLKGMAKGNYFVPGAWLAVVHKALAKADEIEKAGIRAVEKIERQTLMDQLQIGREV